MAKEISFLATITCRPLRCAPATGEGRRTRSLNRAQAAVRFEGPGLLGTRAVLFFLFFSGHLRKMIESMGYRCLSMTHPYTRLYNWTPIGSDDVIRCHPFVIFGEITVFRTTSNARAGTLFTGLARSLHPSVHLRWVVADGGVGGDGDGWWRWWRWCCRVAAHGCLMAVLVTVAAVV